LPLLMLLVFALTLFTSATLLFLVQPMVGKMITPLLGGTPAVWNTCMVFFQALLLVGYAYAHASTAWLGARKQAVLHLLVLLVPFAFFPLAVDRSRALGDRDPVVTVLLLLTFTVGVPFLVVSTSAPLLQKWFASTDHPAARDPYFLYGASNLGSMLALLGYPTLVEPWLSLASQRWLWCAGYGGLTLLGVACAIALWRSAPAPEPTASPPPGSETDLPLPVAFVSRSSIRRGGNADLVKTTPPAKWQTPPRALLDDRVTAGRRLRWVALAAVPSSLMLGATTFMTTDIAAIPLLWVLPLTLYLLSFIIVFSQISPKVQAYTVFFSALAALGIIAWVVPYFVSEEKLGWINWLVWLGCGLGAFLAFRLSLLRDSRLIHRVFVLALPLMILLLLFVMLSSSGFRKQQIVPSLTLHLLTLFAVAMVCHGELAIDRPAPRHLTEFFLWMSVGGVIGGLFNALLAPLIFNGIVEYQLAMVVACFLVPPLTSGDKENKWSTSADVILLVLFTLIGGVLLALRVRDKNLEFDVLQGQLGALVAAALGVGLLVGLVSVALDKKRSAANYLDVALPFALVLLVTGLYWGLHSAVAGPRVNSFARSIGMNNDRLRVVLTFGVPAVLCYTFVERPIRFGLSVGALALAAAMCATVVARPEFQERSFFGVLKVEKETRTADDDGHALTSMTLMHGTTWHGSQHRDFTDPDEDLRLRQEPLSYYHNTGPIGHVFKRYNDPSRPYGVIGLGTGTMACYALRGQHVTFYDIDPVVRRISFGDDPKHEPLFTFVKDARERGADVHIEMGDARLSMERQHMTEDEKFGLLVVDAFSSDAIPVHLITWESLQLYLEHLRPDGIVLFHISNRYLNLKPVLANFARKGNLTAYVFADEDETALGKARSTWVAIARKPEDLSRLAITPNWDEIQPALKAATLIVGGLESPWKALTPDPKVGVWTDDYSNLLSVFDWGF
jgi:hypothetical protein